MNKHAVGDTFKAIGKTFTVVEIIKKDLLKIKSENGDTFLKSGRFYSKLK